MACERLLACVVGRGHRPASPVGNRARRVACVDHADPALRKRRLRCIGIAVGAGLAFGWALKLLFDLRFSGGDIYPTSSSRRADPLGSKALFQSLAAQPGLDVRQNLDRLSLLKSSPESALFVLGIPPQNLDYPGAKQDDNRVLLDFARKGGRLILAIEHESIELATNSTLAAIGGMARTISTATNAPNPL